MDPDEEAKKLKWLLRFGIGLLITSIFAWGELTYAVFGKSAEGTIIKVENVVQRSSRGRERSGVEVSYIFTDNTGMGRTGSDLMPSDWNGPTSGTIPIVYRAGPDGASRLAGHVNWIGLVLWLAFFVPTAWVLGGWIKESIEYGREKKARAAKEKKPYRF